MQAIPAPHSHTGLTKRPTSEEDTISQRYLAPKTPEGQHSTAEKRAAEPALQRIFMISWINSHCQVKSVRCKNTGLIELLQMLFICIPDILLCYLKEFCCASFSLTALSIKLFKDCWWAIAQIAALR